MRTTAISTFGISVALGMAYATAWGATETPQSLAEAAYKAAGMSDTKLAAAEVVALVTRGSMQAWDPGESESVDTPMKPDWGTSTFVQYWDRSRGLYRIEWDRPRANGQRRKYTEILTDEYDGHMGGYVIGTDGGRSTVRVLAEIEFEGFTWAERFIKIGTNFDFASTGKGFCTRNYFSDPDEWLNLFKVNGEGPPGIWRGIMPVAPDESDEQAVSMEGIQRRLQGIFPNMLPRPVTHHQQFRGRNPATADSGQKLLRHHRGQRQGKFIADGVLTFRRKRIRHARNG